MNNIVKSEKFRKLPITSLITGILSYIGLLLMWLIFENLLKEIHFNEIIVTVLFFAMFGLAITAIVCGSIDLNGIKREKCSIKGKGFDITGIVLGSLFILAVIVFTLSDAPIFH
jgi:hypothetical protein